MQNIDISSLFSNRCTKPPGRLSLWVIRTSIFLVFLAVLTNGQEASAKDLELLMRYLVPVFIIQNFTATCQINDPAFLSELPHGANTVDELSEQTKREITDGLTVDDAKTVVLVAANTALKASRDEMRKLSPEYPKLEAEPLFRWCHYDAKPHILNVVRKNQQEHDEFLKIIEKAKE
jgi:hypothetical protein